MTDLLVRDLELVAGSFQAVSEACFHCHAGEIWGILGPNGSGKTTLLHALAGVNRPSAGDIMVNQQPLSHWRTPDLARQVGLLAQSSPDRFPDQVLDVCLTGLHPHLGRFQWESVAELDAALAALSEVGLAGLEKRWVDSLSGGELQRLKIAVLLLQNPRIWLLDEPSNHLDLRHQIGLLDLLSERIRCNDGIGVIVLHDVNLAARYCSHLIFMKGDGTLASGTVAEMLDADRLSALYGVDITSYESPDGVVFAPR